MPRFDADLVVRLKWLADAHERLEQGGGASEELAEAADEIERLRAENKKLHEKLWEYRRDYLAVVAGDSL